MPENVTTDLIYDELKPVQARVAGLRDDMTGVKSRLTYIDTRLGLVHTDMAHLSDRMDRLENRMERVETRLNIYDRNTKGLALLVPQIDFCTNLIASTNQVLSVRNIRLETFRS
jgi:hypothetical protein